MKKKNLSRYTYILVLLVSIFWTSFAGNVTAAGWNVVDTGQEKCYDEKGSQIACPAAGSTYYGQDAQYNGMQPEYIDNGDGTITDKRTGLMWSKDPGTKMTWAQAVARAGSINLAGYTDWRLPTIKELYSLIDFSGKTGMSADSSIPFIDTEYFVFSYGNTSTGERFIDAQYCSATEYVGTTMDNNATIFGVNFADGRIKGYPKENKTYFVLYVRGETGYGTNRFVDNGDGTVTDLSTGLMWMKNDSGHLSAGFNSDGKLNWQQALEWAENLTYGGYSDWRLPNAKELQSIVDYSRAPDITGTAAIDDVFNTSSIIDGNGQLNYPYFWTGTTHLEGIGTVGQKAVYIAFGEAQGYMQSNWGGYTLMDVHGAGAQRSDPKYGDPADYPYGHGPQGDVISIYNFVRCVRDVSNTETYCTLSVNTAPGDGVAVSVTPEDINGSGDGVSSFTRVYSIGAAVTLTAPAIYNGKKFSGWTIDGTTVSQQSLQLTMNGDRTATAYYNESVETPEIEVNQTNINFTYIRGGVAPVSQTLNIFNIGSGVLNWTAACDVPWLAVNPGSGSGNGVVSVSVDGSGLAVGTYDGIITVSAGNAVNSPQKVNVKLNVLSNSGGVPFGECASPADGAVVRSSVPFTGWALDDVGIGSIKLYRESGGGLIYIGEAVQVEGARPDVQAAYPQYPDNEKAGWGYMMLTNFLPNGGNGTFIIHVVAEDLEGQTTTLGTRTIIADNANAKNPFGAIDTPAQGGTALGDGFINWGWALTPRPNKIPEDGSTIDVWVDGINLGHPKYNVYRSDIAAFFPGYANSNGAVGYFELDTTGYDDGVHLIQWTVKDDGGYIDGIGSRYFSIRNDNRGRIAQSEGNIMPKLMKSRRYVSSNAFYVKKGFREDAPAVKMIPDSNGCVTVEVPEMERIEVTWERHRTGLRGFMQIGDLYKPLPVGSTLDRENNRFLWQPGPGFYGAYILIFFQTDNKGKQRFTRLIVRIKAVKESE